MFCTHCGSEIKDGQAFCTNCGASVNLPKVNNSQNFTDNNANYNTDYSFRTPQGPGAYYYNNQVRDNEIMQQVYQESQFKKIFVAFCIVLSLIVLAFVILFAVPSIQNYIAGGKMITDDNGTYYIDKTGEKHFEEWITYKQNDYYLDKKGYVTKEMWINDYYVNSEGKKVINDWVLYKDRYYYLQKDGTYARKEVLDVDGKTYAFDDYGAMYFNGFFSDPRNASHKLFANADGSLVIKNFVDAFSNTYYLDENGVLAENGWREINGEWYFFNPDGAIIKNSWINNEYYVGETGMMLRNTKAPDGRELDSTGAIIPGQSMIEGTVMILLGGTAGYRFIPGAEVDFYESANPNNIIGKTYTDATGKYQYYLRKGDYKVVIKADGYEAMDSTETVKENENKFTELVALFPSGQTGNGTASGRITNALDGQAVGSTVLRVRKNWNNLTGSLATDQTFMTDSNGNFVLSGLPVGYYTVEASKNNFITGYNNIAILSQNPVTNYNFSINPMMPEDGNIRIVLTWGQNPSDLDSHLIGRKPNGSYFDVYYSNKIYNYNGRRMANLDVDDTSSYGPETETITSDLNGTYVYGVHDFSNRGQSGSNQLSYSNCRVTVYMGSQIVAVYNVPTGRVGTFWEVFRINEDRSITPINQIYNYSPGDYSRFGLPTRTNPIYSAIETITNSTNGSSSSSSSSSSSGDVLSTYRLSSGDNINTTYSYDGDEDVTIKIRRPKILYNPDPSEAESINSSIDSAVEELESWCEEFIDRASSAPKEINFNSNTIVSASSTMIKIKMSGTISYRSSSNKTNVAFMFTYRQEDDTYTLVKQ